MDNTLFSEWQSFQCSCSSNAYMKKSYILCVGTLWQMALVIDTEGPASSVTFGDDTVTVGTLINGTVDSIKLELELLPAVGEVNPSA